MKRVFFLAFLLLSASCAKQELQAEEQEFYVEVSASVQEETKTSLSGTSVLWSEGDQIAFYSASGVGSTLTLKEGAGTTSAIFSGTAKGTMTPYFGFYPAANFISKANVCINYSLPQIQTGADGTFAKEMNPAIAVFPTTQSGGTFFNMLGLVQFTLKGSETIGRLKLVSLNENEMLWGKVAAAINTEKNPSDWTQTITEGSNVLYLDFPDGLTLSETVKKVFFAVPADALASGFKLVAYDKHNIPIDEFYTSGNHAVSRSRVSPMAAISIGKYNILDAEESANCYNICKTNTSLPFKFCAVKGNTTTPVAATSAEEFWEANPNSSAEFNGGQLGYFVTDLALSKNCITFNIKGNAGNALIAAKNGSDIVWSWHIWITNVIPSCSKMLNGTRIMDTNLGAAGPGTISTQLMGFLYQWGRKDPFPAPYHVGYSTLMKFQPAGIITNVAKTDATVDFTIKNPGTFIDISGSKWEAGTAVSVWSESKTAYDPCPPGYRVPTQAELSNLTLGAWDATYYRYQESGTSYYFQATSRQYYSSKSVHTIETANTGYYWTCTNGANQAQMAMFSSAKTGSISGSGKGFAAAVRCVAYQSSKPSPGAKTIKVSLIGDSISTFDGYINTDGNIPYYPREEASRTTADLEVVKVEQTYWWQLINNYMSNAALEKNDSWSGTCVGGYDATSFVARYSKDRIGSPDLVILHGGSNDLAKGTHYLVKDVLISEDDLVHPTAEELQAVFDKADSDYTTLSESLFIESYVKLMLKIKADCPDVEFLLILGDRISISEQKAIIAIANRYGAHYVDFLALGRNCLEKQAYVHPSIKGMAAMSKYIYDREGEWLESL